MQTVVGIRFRNGGKVYYFDPGELDINEGDHVIVETAQGLEYATAAYARREVGDDQVVTPLKPVVRLATVEDEALYQELLAKEPEAYEICLKKIEEHCLDMKLSGAEYAFSGNKLTFYFTADGRIDFRELVKDLASVFKMRIELSQIGVRDEARLMGGLGACGRTICCRSFLSDFQSVSIKMAKEQNLSLSPTKISGVCGRLMCCLQYEYECYECTRKLMPDIGREVVTEDGPGVVLENNIITERTRVKVALKDGTYEIREYPFRELTVIDG